MRNTELPRELLERRYVREISTGHLSRHLNKLPDFGFRKTYARYDGSLVFPKAGGETQRLQKRARFGFAVFKRIRQSFVEFRESMKRLTDVVVILYAGDL